MLMLCSQCHIRPRRHYRTLCSKCIKENYKRKDITAFTYYVVQHNAKRRGISFTITLAEWRDFCKRTNYIELKGVGAGDMTLDRINPNLGYSLDNMQVLTNADNVRKKYQDSKISTSSVAPIDVDDILNTKDWEDSEDCPF